MLSRLIILSITKVCLTVARLVVLILIIALDSISLMIVLLLIILILLLLIEIHLLLHVEIFVHLAICEILMSIAVATSPITLSYLKHLIVYHLLRLLACVSIALRLRLVKRLLTLCITIIVVLWLETIIDIIKMSSN